MLCPSKVALSHDSCGRVGSRHTSGISFSSIDTSNLSNWLYCRFHRLIGRPHAQKRYIVSVISFQSKAPNMYPSKKPRFVGPWRELEVRGSST